jgi:hypothetical protein
MTEAPSRAAMANCRIEASFAEDEDEDESIYC